MKITEAQSGSEPGTPANDQGQVWLLTTRSDVPPTNNGSESAIRGFKLAAKVQGCWRTLATLQRHCRITLAQQQGAAGLPDGGSEPRALVGGRGLFQLGTRRPSGPSQCHRS